LRSATVRHLFGAAEQAAFTPGRRLAEVFTLCNGVRCCLLVCYDVEFPEAVRSCALAGASLVLTPTANFFPYTFANEPIIRVRAYENHLCVVYANWAEHKNEDGVHFNGQSVVASAVGELLLMLAASDRGLFLAEALEDVRRGGAAAGQGGEQLRDRRPMIYRTSTEEEGLAACPARELVWKLAVAGAFTAGLLLGALAKKPR
jgi:5-aminopentanamidase